MENRKRRAQKGLAVGGFTLMELMVSIAIMVVIILSVGMTFSGASRAVGMSQATMEEMAAVRATQQLIERDLRALDRNGFLVIRSRVLNSNLADVPNMAPLRYIDISQRYDQLSFMAQGTFSNQTGADTANPFTDSTTTNSAHIWWGQLILEKNGADAIPTNPPYLSYVPADQSAKYAQDLPPTGVVAGNGGGLTVTKESDFALGRHATLLIPGPADVRAHVMPAGQNVMAYPNIDGTKTDQTIAGAQEGASAHITSSRYAVAAQTSPQVMQYIMASRAAGSSHPEADFLTYRFRALDSVYDTEVAANANPFVNGYFRTTPMVMRGVSSFKVEWTDGATYLNPDPRAGQLVWFGPGNVNGNSALGERIGTGNGDNYDVTFSYMNKTYWPRALRITMHVANERIGGRDFVQVVNLPQ